MDGNRAIRSATAGVVTAVAGFAAVVSYSHIHDLAGQHGQSKTAALLLPLSVDGLILAASLVLLHEARNARTAPARAWLMLGLGVAATLAANVLSGLPDGWLNACISAWPAVAFVGAVEMVMWMIRKARPEAPEITRGVAASDLGDTVSSDSVEAARARMRLAQIHGFKISDNDLRAQFRLTRSEATRVRTEVLAETNGHALADAVDQTTD
jgi:hypothetical protein